MLKLSLLSVVLLLSACSDGAGAISGNAPKATAEDGSDVPVEAGTVPTPIQPDVPTQTGVIKPILLGQKMVGADCAIAVDYGNLGKKTVMWTGEPCSAVDISIVTETELKAVGQLDDLDQAVLQDMQQYNHAGMVLVESSFTMSIYLLDAKGQIREVSLAD